MRIRIFEVRTSPSPHEGKKRIYGRLYYEGHDAFWSMAFPSLQVFDDVRRRVEVKGKGWRLQHLQAKNLKRGEKAAALDKFFDEPEVVLNFIERLASEWHTAEE